jgi:UDPglucose 6-dehydrogenase
MQVGFIGTTHLGKTLKQASQIRRIQVTDDIATADLVFVTPDVEDHNRLFEVDTAMGHAILNTKDGIPIVLASQVPPGYTRRYSEHDVIGGRRLYYQVDTIIMNCALKRATFPERIIVGDSIFPLLEELHPTYQQWLDAFECPIHVMSYESAEMCKLAVNYYLAKQVETTNKLATVAKLVGADWSDMIPALRADYRIGQSYIVPGTIEGSHLVRDVKTIDQLTPDEEASGVDRVAGWVKEPATGTFDRVP